MTDRRVFPDIGPWASRAACRDHPNPDLWFPEGITARTTIALVICERCPVRIDCLEYALDNAELFGIWGGTGERQRRRIRRYRRDQAA